MGESRGFFGALFDISFSALITTKVIKFLYVLSMIVIGLVALFIVGAGFANSAASGVFALVVIAPLGGLLYLVYVRVLLELVIVIFRIMETNVELVELQRGQRSGGSGPPPPAPSGPEAPTLGLS